MADTRNENDQHRDTDLSRAGRWVTTIAAIAAVVAGGVLVALVLTRDDGGGSDDPVAQSASGGLTGGDFHSIAVDPSNPERIFVGGHQAVSESTDAGATWSEIPALRNADAMGWAFTSDNVYVSGHPGSPCRSIKPVCSNWATTDSPIPTCTHSEAPTTCCTRPAPESA